MGGSGGNGRDGGEGFPIPASWGNFNLDFEIMMLMKRSEWVLLLMQRVVASLSEQLKYDKAKAG